MTINLAVHPGRILKDEFLDPLGLSPIALAKHIGVPRTRIERLVSEQVSMSPDTANLLAAALKTSPTFWLNLQTNYDVAMMKPPRGIKPLELAH